MEHDFLANLALSSWPKEIVQRCPNHSRAECLTDSASLLIISWQRVGPSLFRPLNKKTLFLRDQAWPGVPPFNC